MVMGQEERKNKAKLEKTQIQLASNSNEYEAAVKTLEETTGRWNKEWKSACDVCVHLEVDGRLLTVAEIPRFRRGASRLYEEQSLDLCKHCIDRMRQRRCCEFKLVFF